MVPAAAFFSSDVIRRNGPPGEVLVYGPAHLMRAAWLAGARDYLKDPWTPEELFLRLRGPVSVTGWEGREGPCRLDGRTVLMDGGTVRLSAAEADLLRILVQRRGAPVSREVLGWAAGCSEGRVVDTLVGRLRKKLGGRAGEIVSVRGVGYRLP